MGVSPSPTPESKARFWGSATRGGRRSTEMTQVTFPPDMPNPGYAPNDPTRACTQDILTSVCKLKLTPSNYTNMGQQELDDRELGYIDLFCSSFFFLASFFFLRSSFSSPSCAILPPSCAILALPCAILGSLLGHLGSILAQLGSILGHLGSILGHLASPKLSQSLPRLPQSLPRLPQPSPQLPRGSPEAPRAKNHKSAKKSWNITRCFDTIAENNWPKLFLEEFTQSIPFSRVLHKNAQKIMKNLSILHNVFTTFSLRILSVICQNGRFSATHPLE